MRNAASAEHRVRGPILYLVSFDAIEAAITWQVAELSKARQAGVVLLAVTRPSWLSFLAQDGHKEARRQLLDVARRLRGLKGHVAGVKLARGDTVSEALRAAQHTGAELIMLGAGEESAHDEAHVGATAAALARRARQDVWIAKPLADPHVEHVLCAADTSVCAGDALRRSAELCRRFNARLRVVSVLQEPVMPPRGASEFADADAEAQAQHRAQKDYLDGFDLRGIALSRAIVWAAHAPAELALEAERYADGLLVMGASGTAQPSRTSPRTGLGATAEAMLHSCPSSLLIVRKRRRGLPEHSDASLGTSVAYS